ncbi:prephenate dehydrogenase [Streptomyces sp. YIM 130001]|uniref:prephenate dehydrogenase/arogenate dehydrogenase family protein n=1 Tax=Streptomyces sp. YIM 130001 TaxID=2259644 RepID=UPI000EEB00EF|nr:prephenate dehydrogenase/arogenate dehydrogenase family protein [Streptomyces sp. YIM 130001]RII06888.1 prephenate dehydrogenase [Streptomyces sp. YIM 130001]
MTPTVLQHVTVIGCGLTGTSIALALRRAGAQVALSDLDPQAVTRARALGAGTELLPDTPPADLVVIATAPGAVVDALYEAQAHGRGRAYTDVARGKQEIWAEARLRGCDLWGYLPGYPLPPGPAGARTKPSADRFAGRPWFLCPYPLVEPEALDAVGHLIAACGALRVDSTPADVDHIAS